MSYRHDPDLLTRTLAAALLRSYGIPASDKMLAAAARREGGPLFFKFGRKALYRRADLLSWAGDKLGAPWETVSKRSNGRGYFCHNEMDDEIPF